MTRFAQTGNANHQLLDNISFMLNPFSTEAQISQSASLNLLYFASNGLRVAAVNQVIDRGFVIQRHPYSQIRADW